MHCQGTEFQPTAGARGQVHRLHRRLSSETEEIRCRTATGNNGLPPQFSQRFNDLLNCGRAQTEASLYRPDIDALTDPH